MSKNTKIILIAVLCGVIACVFAVSLMLSVFFLRTSSSAGSDENTTQTAVTQEEAQHSSEETTADTTEATTVEPATHKTEPATSEEIITFREESTVEPSSDKVLPSAAEEVLKDNSFYIVKGTPGGAGLVMRDAPSSTSQKIGVAEEGTKVYVYSDDASNKTGYVRVMVSDTYTDYNCYVLRSYLEYYGPAGSADGNGGETAIRHIAYSTPAHAGVNLRAGASADSELLCLIEEGEQVKLIGDYSEKNGYVRVSYDHPHAGEVYEGWLLAAYLTY